MATLFRYSAFSNQPQGGNPAGVWIGDALPDDATMQQIAADVGFSETAFIAPAEGNARTVRYFSPEMEVPFCGHATIASGVVLGELHGEGHYHLTTQAGEIPVAVSVSNGEWTAALTSVAPRYDAVPDALLTEALAALGWNLVELDPTIPPAIAYAGAHHLVLAVNSAETLATLSYNFDQLKTTMQQHNLVTLQLIWRESETVFHSRNPFPVGGIVEDPATGAAAAALGGYLREAGLVNTPTTLLIRQGETMGRPSKLTVTIPPTGGIVVSGTAVAID